MNQELLVHESTYRKRNLVGLIHRNRLRAIQRAFLRHVDPATSSWVDFGCSNGFVIEEIVNMKRFSFTKLVGIDHSPELLDAARAKNIANAEFRFFDLNTVQAAPEQFDLVTCLETLEHVGNVESAIANLVEHVRPGGLLLLTVPNETGLPGLLKYGGRMAVRRNPYGDFFARGSRADYVMHLLTYRRIDGFREPGRRGWGPHLGFDYRRMRDEIEARYVKTGRLAPMAEDRTALGMNLLFLYRRRT